MAADEPTNAAFTRGGVEGKEAGERILKALEKHLESRYEHALKLKEALRSATEMLVDSGYAITTDRNVLAKFFDGLSHEAEKIEGMNDKARAKYLAEKHPGVFFKAAPKPAEGPDGPAVEQPRRGMRRGSTSE